ncbi:hypothetical protein GPICK_15895 [Geobacter pickeringii]|uniref:Membrane iron-sulfur containing protein FtrD-like domain-containing protein n=1 Tax=Geobacter pickeringii TaxID=345632 RepID=A0A0B5BLM7_9BACT|nr:hypothetical protein GPICK_15895 [Geobacter pickeringii]
MITIIQFALAWLAAAFLISSGSGDGRRAARFAAAAGFVLGGGAAVLLGRMLPAEGAAAVARGVVAVLFFLPAIAGVLLLYRNAGVEFGSLVPAPLGIPSVTRAALAGAVGAAAGLLAVLSAGSRGLPMATGVVAAGLLLHAPAGWAGSRVGKRLPLTGETLALALVALLLFMGSLSPRLDLFAPLCMKLMKFTHDFVHQFFESMLIPDHLFFSGEAWNVIGFLFGNDVGFWGGLAIWFAPLLLIAGGTAREPLPSVAHIRQGAERRTVLAGHLRERRRRLALPFFTTLLLALAVYRSLHPAVSYWDPKPMPVSADARGEIAIAAKGEGYDLDDGRLHKFLYRQGKSEVRFLVLRKPDGTTAVTLDACAICQPQGYGQGEGAVICWYCKTLIPLETVGEAGGCNPVPLPFAVVDGGVRITAATMISTWDSTVQGTKNVPGGK